MAMSRDEREDTRQYKVVINHEEQYSIWPADRENPLGWNDEGMRGSRQMCLDHVAAVWKDMRPLSLRRHMEELAQHQDAGTAPLPEAEPLSGDHAADNLVNRLCSGDHAVELVLRPEKTREALEHNLARGCVHIKFTGTRGGTELDVTLDPDRIASAIKDLQHRQTMLLEGSLRLNYVNVRCVAEIDTKTFTGRGGLEVVQERQSVANTGLNAHGSTV
jgi:uncharacterized protein YbdZ (MbtH family)